MNILNSCDREHIKLKCASASEVLKNVSELLTSLNKRNTENSISSIVE